MYKIANIHSCNIYDLKYDKMCMKCVYIVFFQTFFKTTYISLFSSNNLRLVILAGKKRVQVTFTNEQWQILNKLKGELGNTDSEMVRNIVIAWLAEKSVISDILKKHVNNNDK